MSRTGTRTASVSIAGGVVLLALACQGLVEPLPDPPNVEATVAEVSIERSLHNRIQTLSVDHLPEEMVAGWLEDEDRDRWPEASHIRVRVCASSQTTAYFMQSPFGVSAASMDNVKVGDRIRIWINSELRSLPPQWGAGQIVILRD